MPGAQAAAHHVRPTTRSFATLIVLLGFLLCVFGLEENASEALLKFKSSLANAETPLANWDKSTTPCSGNNGNWRGVLCFNGYVWGLQLENMNLRGQIDVNSLVPLKFLRTLSFMNNDFEGTMPDWRKIGALKSLYLSNNGFSGQIREDAFKGMTSLKKVYMANNKFTGHIPSSLESPKLIELRLENNQFTGSIPAVSSDNLKSFNVSNNQLEGPIPEGLLKLDPSSFSDKEFNPLLMDYTLVPVVNPGQVHDILVAYKSPEYAQHRRTAKKTDVWCLGILILETLTGKYVGKYLSQGSGPYGPELAGWINTIVAEAESKNAEVFDEEIRQEEGGNCKVEMEKLLQIGIACCEEDVEKRLDLEEVVKKIEEIGESGDLI